MEVAFPANVEGALAPLARRILGGLRSLFVYSATGIGRARIAGHAHAHDLVRSAVRHASAIFDAGQRTELNGFMAKSKVRMCLFLWEDLLGCSMYAPTGMQRHAHVAE